MEDRIGQQFGSYRLVRLLGKGGFAKVYLGEHIQLKTEAAIKVLHTQLASDAVEQFRTEAHTIADLVHPRIVQVLDFGVEDKIPFLVMEYAPHSSVRTRYPRGSRLPPETIITYVKQVADALQYIHEQKKLVHRDVKPENMLLRTDQDLLLSDFGIVVAAHTTGSLILTDQAGTLHYMAPEQLQGKPRPASDQYALGIVVYEWICGGCPFQGPFTQMASQHLLTSPPPLHEQVPTITPDVEQVVLKALAKDPKERFASVQAFAAALEQAYQKEKEQAHSIPVAQQSTSQMLLAAPSRIPSLPPNGDVPFQHLVPSLDAASLSGLHPASPSTISTPNQPSFSPPLAVPAFLPHQPVGERPVFSILNQANAVSISPQRSSPSKDKLILLISLTLLIALLGGLGIYYSTTINNWLPGTVETRATATAEPQTTVAMIIRAWTYPTGGAITSSATVANGIVYVGSSDHKLYALNAKSGTLLWTYPTEGRVLYSSPTVANGVVYAGAGGRLYALNARTGTLLWTYTTGHFNFIGSSATVANGVVYISSSDHKLIALNALNARTGTLLWTYPTEGATVFSNPTVANGVVYIDSSDHTLIALNAQTGVWLWTYLTGGAIESSPTVANGVVCVSSGDHTLYALDAQTGAKLWTYPTGNYVASPTIANGIVYVGSGDHTLYALDAQTGAKLWTHLTGGAITSSPTVANGVVYVGSGDHTLYAFPV